MTRLIYGGGNVSIEGSSVRGVEIRYSGAIEIEDMTPVCYSIIARNNGIIIYPNPIPYNGLFLNNLFNYIGKFEVRSVIVADDNANRVATSIHKMADYPELLKTYPDDMTINVEDMSMGDIYKKTVSKTIVDNKNINNLHTSKHDGNLYDKNGDLYEGDFHVHPDLTTMTEKEHSETSEMLYLGNNIDPKVDYKTPFNTAKSKSVSKKGRY